jgi:hypothetical protein
MTQDPDPREALASIRDARAGFPVGGDSIAYDLFYGAACGLLVAGQGMPRPWDFIALVIALAAFALMIMWWRKKFGWWVSGYSPKRARWVAFALVAVLVGLMGLSLYGRYVGPDWLWMVSGGLGFVFAVAGGRLWMRVWRRELAEGPK